MSRKTKVDSPADGPRVRISVLATKAALLCMAHPNEWERIPAPVAVYGTFGGILGWRDGRA